MYTLDLLNDIKETIFFNKLSINEIDEILKGYNIKIIHYNKGDIIFIELDKTPHFEIIISGLLHRELIDSNGSIVHGYNLKNGDSYGGGSLFNLRFQRYDNTIAVVKDTTVLSFSKDQILDLCQNNRYFLEVYLTNIAYKISNYRDKFEQISYKTVREKIIYFLNKSYHLEKSYEIKLTITKKALSEELRVERTSLSRELSKMKREGLIDFDRTYIKILDKSIIEDY